jgi:putative tryptophan/tyrosine transport system substrate-binding protein
MRRKTICGSMGIIVAFGVVASAGIPSALADPPPKRLGILADTPCAGPSVPRTAIGWAFVNRLAELGWTENKTLVFDCVTAGNRIDGYAPAATELVGRRPDVLFGFSTNSIRALKQATATIPIVMRTSDPLREGLVANLARPEGNVTGLGEVSLDLVGKRLELLKEIVPELNRVAVFFRKDAELLVPGVFEQLQKEFSAAGKALGFGWQMFRPTVPEDLDDIFAQGFDAVYVHAGPFAFGARMHIGELSVQRKVPTVGEAWSESGVLLTHGVDQKSSFVRAAEYIDKVLRGAKPADLPVEQPTKFHLAVNLKTAKAIGLTVPPTLLARADEVIE